jgi:hypothetical protein
MITGGKLATHSDQDPGLKVTLNAGDLPPYWAGRVTAIVKQGIADRRWPEDGEELPGLVDVALESDGEDADLSEHEIAKWVVDLLADAGEIRQHGSATTEGARSRACERLMVEAVARYAHKGRPVTTAPVQCPNCDFWLTISNRREHVNSGCLLAVLEGVLSDRGYEPDELDLSKVDADVMWERFGGKAADWVAQQMGLTPYPAEPEGDLDAARSQQHRRSGLRSRRCLSGFASLAMAVWRWTLPARIRIIAWISGGAC